MINLFSLLFSLVVVAIVVVRASMLDRRLPWFGVGEQAASTPSRLAFLARKAR